MKTREMMAKEAVAERLAAMGSRLSHGEIARFSGLRGRRAYIRMVKTQIGPYFEIRTLSGNEETKLTLLPTLKDALRLLDERNYMVVGYAQPNKKHQ